jgi:hypothetical protein
LYQIDLAATDGLFERYFKFTVGKVLDVHLAEFDTKVLANLLGHILRVSAGEDLERG